MWRFFRWVPGRAWPVGAAAVGGCGAGDAPDAWDGGQDRTWSSSKVLSTHCCGCDGEGAWHGGTYRELRLPLRSLQWKRTKSKSP